MRPPGEIWPLQVNIDKRKGQRMNNLQNTGCGKQTRGLSAGERYEQSGSGRGSRRICELSPKPRRITHRGITVHSQEDFDGMRKAGRVVASILDDIADDVVPGVTTGEIDRQIQNLTEISGAESATIGYRGYRHASCISVNHVVCHGIPGERKLVDGDILNIDVTVILDGWYGDSSRMYSVGRLSRKAQRLIQAAHDALMVGIEAVKPGNSFGDLGFAIQNYIHSQRMSVVRDFCGHGLGRKFHELPNVKHFGTRGEGPVMEEGMFFTIEPMVNLGAAPTRILPDGWTAVTRDRSLSAQFEHSVGVTSDGVEIFTGSPANRFHPAN